MQEFTEEKVRSGYENLYKEMQQFLGDYELAKHVKVDEVALTHGILDYFTDISRLKKLHGIRMSGHYRHLPNCHDSKNEAALSAVSTPQPSFPESSPPAQPAAYGNKTPFHLPFLTACSAVRKIPKA